MNWSKFLSRKFLLAVIIMILGLINVFEPGLIGTIPWNVIVIVLTYILGESGVDIVRGYLDYKNGKH